jgi:hypothetical protein
VIKTEFALTDITIAQVGLFRSHRRCSDSRLVATKASILWNGTAYTYVSPFLLDASDWKLFATLCAMAGLDKVEINATTAGDSKQLFDNLFMASWLSARKALVVTMSGYQLLQELGRGRSEDDYDAVRSGLHRLAHVSISIKNETGEEMGGCSLLSFKFDKELKELTVVLSPLASQYLLGICKQHLRLSLIETRALSSDAAVLLHAYLSSRIRLEKWARFEIDALVTRVYGSSKTSKIMRDRRTYIRKAIVEIIERLGWQGRDLKESHCHIGRPKLQCN